MEFRRVTGEVRHNEIAQGGWVVELVRYGLKAQRGYQASQLGQGSGQRVRAEPILTPSP